MLLFLLRLRFRPHARRPLPLALSLFIPLLLSGCGGGGEGGSVAPPTTFPVSVAFDAGVDISPGNVVIASGAQASFTVTLKPLYSLVQATGCGGTLIGNIFATAPVTGPCTVTVTSRHANANFGLIKLKPNALFDDEFATTPVTLEVVTDGRVGIRLSAEYPTGWFDKSLGFGRTIIPLRDDGTNGDRFAGDGVHSARFTTGMNPRLRWHDGTVDRVPISIVTRNEAGDIIAPAIKGIPEVQLGVVKRSLAVPTVTVAPGVFAASHMVNIVMPNVPSPPDVTKSLYTHYKDDFDGFALFYLGATAAQGYAGGSAVKSAVQGINLPLYDNSAVFGSTGALTSGVHMFIDVVGEVFNHELAHTWAFWLNKPSLELTDGTGFHAGLSTVLGPMAHSSSRLEEMSTGDFQSSFINNSTISNRTFTDLDLYLMGLLPAEAVTPAYYLNDRSALNGASSGVIPRSKVRRVTIDDVIAEYGARIPAAGAAPTTHRFVFIALTEQAATPAEIALINRVAAFQESNSDGGSIDTMGFSTVNPSISFQRATRGLGRVVTKLPNPKRSDG